MSSSIINNKKKSKNKIIDNTQSLNNKCSLNKKVIKKDKNYNKDNNILLPELKRYDDKLLPTFKKILLPKRIYKRLEILSLEQKTKDIIKNKKEETNIKKKETNIKKKETNIIDIFNFTICENVSNIDMNINIIGNMGVGKSLLLDCFLFNKFKIRQNDINGSTNNKFIKSINNIFIIKLPCKKEDINELKTDIMEISESRGAFKCGKLMIIKNFNIYPKIIKNIINFISEKRFNNIKFITTCKSITYLPHKYSTLSYNILISSMNDNEFLNYYKKLGNKYDTKLLNSKIALKIYKYNNRNLKQSINIISSILNGRKKDINYKPSYNIIKTIVISILNKLDFNNINSIDSFRNILYEVLMLGINYRDLLKETIKIIISDKNIDNDAKMEIIKASSDADNEIIDTQNREFYAIEKFYYIIFTHINKK